MQRYSSFLLFPLGLAGLILASAPAWVASPSQAAEPLEGGGARPSSPAGFTGCYIRSC